MDKQPNAISSIVITEFHNPIVPTLDPGSDIDATEDEDPEEAIPQIPENLPQQQHPQIPQPVVIETNNNKIDAPGG